MQEKSIDEHMAEDEEYREEVQELFTRFDKELAEAKTDEERKAIRREAVMAYQNANLSRYDRAKAKALRKP